MGNEKKIENIIITPEYIEKIKQFSAILPEQTIVYTPIAYRDLPEELKPKFTVRPITGENALQYADDMRGEVMVENGKAQVMIKTGAYTIAVVKKGLLGWENYYSIDGTLINYNGKIDNLPRALLEELSDIITSAAQLTNEEKLGLK